MKTISYGFNDARNTLAPRRKIRGGSARSHAQRARCGGGRQIKTKTYAIGPQSANK